MVHHGKFRVLSNQMFKFILMTLLFIFFLPFHLCTKCKEILFCVQGGRKKISLCFGSLFNS